MRRAGMFVTLFALAATSVAQEAAPALDPQVEAALRAVGENFSKAWNAGEAGATAELFTESGDVVDAMGTRASGRSEIEAWAVGQRQQLEGYTHSNEATNVRLASPELAVVDGTFSVTPPSGAETPAFDGFFTAVLRKQGDNWKIEALRAWSRPEPGAAAATEPA
jgi:uncharacterized protein (TIGR02246 family)